jgi:Flp pilus assembly protein TadD
MDRAMAVADAAYRNAAVALDSRGAKNQHKAHGEVDLGGSHADYTTSVEYLQRAVAAAPQDAAAWNSLGLAFYRLRRFYEAESAFEEAVRLSDQSKDYHANLQAARERLGDKPHDPRIR